jgi:Protein of unknown function (DUF3891)
MFKSKRRPIVTPQSEHLKLVGTLALLWGNADFDFPPVERLSMVVGMGFHDRGYGFLDNSPIGGMTDEEWAPIARRSFYTQYSDVTADMIAKYHFRRLAGHTNSEQRKALAAEFSREIEKQLAAHQLSKELFDRLDRITDLCDMLSFNFCFELPAEGSISVFPRNDAKDEVSIHYRVEDGNIHASPWPFSVDTYEGYIVGYKLDGYPDQLDPVILPFHLRK